MTYLGMPLVAHSKDASIWNPIIIKMEKRLSGWKPLHASGDWWFGDPEDWVV